MPVAKLSITVEEADLRWVRSEAKRLKQSVSAVVADAIAQKRAVRAQRQYLKNAGPVDDAELRRAMEELRLVNGITLDTGALIGLERRTERMKAVMARIAARQLPVTIPSVVVAEWYREQRDAKRILVLAKLVEPTTATLAELAGKALRATGGSNTIDAIVMASAAQRGDVVYTSDVDDLLGFADVFPEVRVLGVGGN